jgi:hypothetical protein
MIGNQNIRRFAAALLAAAVLLTAGCKSSNPAASPATTTAPPERPQVTAAPDKATAPPVNRYDGYTLRIRPAYGPEILLKEPSAVQLILDCFSSKRLQVTNAVGRFQNKADILSPDGDVRYAFTMASDGQLLMKYSDGRVFQMPEYVYYLIEQSLWTYAGTLMDTQLKWKPDPKNATQSQLELDLPRLLKTSMLPAFGYALAYFCSYKIYGVNTSARDSAKVYLLMTVAGYDVKGTAFAPLFLYTTPATLIFNKAGTDTWQLTGLKQPPETKEKRDLYANVRTIFPYDWMEAVLADLNDTSFQVKDIEQQATEYLNEMGINGLTVES